MKLPRACDLPHVFESIGLPFGLGPRAMREGSHRAEEKNPPICDTERKWPNPKDDFLHMKGDSNLYGETRDPTALYESPRFLRGKPLLRLRASIQQVINEVLHGLPAVLPMCKGRLDEVVAVTDEPRPSFSRPQNPSSSTGASLVGPLADLNLVLRGTIDS